MKTKKNEKGLAYIAEGKQFDGADSLYFPVEKAANLFPKNTALRFLGKNISYKTLAEKVSEYSSCLLKAGLKKGEAVTFALPNIPESVYLLYATQKAELRTSPLHPLSTPEAVSSAIEKTGSRIVFALGDAARKIAERCASATVVAVSPANSLGIKKLLFSLRSPLPKKSGNLIRLSDFLKTPQNTPLVSHVKICPAHQKTSVLLQSGGTTGTPKVIGLSADSVNNLAARGMGILGKNDVTRCGMLSVLPVFHGFGLAMGVHAMLCHGGKNVLFPKFHRASAVREIRKGNVQFVIGVPRLYEALLSHPKFAGKALRSLAVAYVGGDFVPRTLLKEYDAHIKKFGGKSRLYEGYGLTETVTVCSVNTDSANKDETVGKPLAGMEIRAFDFSGDTPRELPPNEKGELGITGDTLMQEYLSDEKSTAEAFFSYNGKNYVRTGDCGYTDEEGFIHFVSRFKRIVKVKGIPVYPMEIEQLAITVEGVGAACAVPLTEKPESIVLFIEGTDETLKERLKKLIREKISIYAEPSEVFLVKSFPVTNMSKTDTNALLELYRSAK